MQLSPNFTLAELCKSQTAIRQGIDNMADADSIFHLRNLCEHVLQPVRNNFGPVVVNSGFRSKALTDVIGGSSRSQHCRGLAADIECPALSNYELASWIEENCDFDQLILEGYTSGSPRSGWVHVSFAGKNRWEVLTASFSGGRASYRHGLVQ